MIPHYSVRKPYTVLVGVILALVLGIVSITKMSTDLLPNINLPYVIVMTTYVGATPETVETVVTEPVEAAMATISNIEGITSMSAENYSVVILEFAQSTNMDSVSLDIRESLDLLESYWDDSVGTPVIMKLNPNMLPLMIVAAGVDDMDAFEAGTYIEDKIVPRIKSIEGVADVSTTGIIENSVSVVIREDKVNVINQKVSSLIDDKFEEAYADIEKAREEISDGESELSKSEKEIKDAEGKLESGKKEVSNGRKELESKQDSTISELSNAKLQLLTAKADLEAAKTAITTNITTLDTLVNTKNDLTEKKTQLETLNTSLSMYETNLKTDTQTAIAGLMAMPDDAGLLTLKEALLANPLLAGIVPTLSAMDFSSANTELVTQYSTVIDGYYTSMAGALTEVVNGLSTVDDGISNLTMGMGVDSYKSTQNSIMADLNSKGATVDENILKIYEGETTAAISFANGLSQLDLAEYKIESSKATIDAGKEQMESARKQIDEARKQLDDGLEQLEDTKIDAKESADMLKTLSVDTISALLSAQNFSMPAGYVEEGNDSYLIRIGDKPESVEELSNMTLMKLPLSEDEVIRLSDVCDIFATSNAEETYTNVNGKPGVVLTIQKQTGYSTGDVSDLVKEKMEDLCEENSKITLASLMDQGIYIDLVMDTIVNNVLLGGALAILILVLFLRDIRPTLIIAISIPISLITAIVGMYFSGVTLNIISLSGLALGVGMLVDNSIVVIENIYRLRSEGVPMREAAVEGAKEVAGAIFASTVTTICVFLPIVFTEGLVRQLFVDMGLTIAYSLLASLVIALTVVPSCASVMLTKVKNHENKENSRFRKLYKSFLSGCLKYKAVVFAVAVLLLGLSFWGAYQNGFEYFPDMESNQVTVTVTLNEDSTKTDVIEDTDCLIEKIMKIDDVVDVGAMSSATTLSLVGGMGGTESDAIKSTTIYVTTVEKDREYTSKELAAVIMEAGKDLPDVSISVETSTMDMSALGGSGISVSIKGRELDTLYSLAEEAETLIETVEGTKNVVADIADANEELRVHVDKEKAAKKGLTVAEVFGQIYPKLSDASKATTLSTQTEDISVYVEDEADSLLSRNDIRNFDLVYKDEDGKEAHVKLSEIATFEDGVSLNTIYHDGQTRYVGITAEVEEGYNVSFVANDVEKALSEIELPTGYEITYGGENEYIMEAIRQLLLMLVLAVVLIYLVMVAQFQSLGSPFIIMFTIPLAFTGGFAMLFFTSSTISIVCMVGFVMLSGIIVNNGIVLVDYINQRRAEGLLKKEAILDASITRLRPVIMTALTTILALISMAFSKELGADMSRPLAYVVIGGMVYGTLMTLIIVPCIYDAFVREKKQSKA